MVFTGLLATALGHNSQVDNIHAYSSALLLVLTCSSHIIFEYHDADEEKKDEREEEK